MPEQVAALGETAEATVKWVPTGKIYEANNILTRDGLFWAISSMVKNFINFAPLGIVLVGMLGIGIAERTGFIGSAPKGGMGTLISMMLPFSIIFSIVWTIMLLVWVAFGIPLGPTGIWFIRR